MSNHLKGLNINSIYDLDNAFSINELLCKFWKKIEEVVNITNESIDILNWLKEEGLPDEVINLLSTWKDDGTLGTIINSALFNELNTKVDTFQEKVNSELQAKKLEIDNILKGNKSYSELHYINNFADESSVLFKCKNGEIVLVDCGESFSSGGIYNRLKALGVTKINHFIITHFHSDHVGGYNMIFDNFIVDNVYFKPITWNLSNKEIGWKTNSLYDGFIARVEQLGINYYSLTEDTTININDNEKITLMNTSPYPFVDKSTTTDYNVYDYNYESLMCLYTNGVTKVLLQSDCPSQVAFNNYGNTIKNIDHLQISHHGGNDIVNQTWIDSIRAKTGFCSYLPSTNIEHYKGSTLTKIYKYDFNVSISGCILITDGGLYPTVSMIENKLSDRFLDYLGNKVYIDSVGDMVENGIITNNGKKYIIKDWYKQLPSPDGWCYAISEQSYALKSDGSIKCDQWVTTNGKNYYVDNQGIYIKNGIYKIGTTDVNLDSEGHATNL